MRRKRSKRWRFAYLSLFFVLLYLPILAVILYSFNQSPSTAQWTGFTLDWYRDLFHDTVILESLSISLQVGLMTSLLSAVLGTATAISTSYVTKGMQKAIQGIMIAPLLLPEVALGISLLLLFTAIKLPFGRLTLVLAHSIFCVPYVFIMVQLRLQEIDKSIIEAARDLGASRWTVVKTILLPLVVPSIVTSSLLALSMSLDDVVISTYMSGPTSTTLPVHIFSMMRVGVTPKINALSTITLVVTFFLIGLSQFIGRSTSSKEKKT